MLISEAEAQLLGFVYRLAGLTAFAGGGGSPNKNPAGYRLSSTNGFVKCLESLPQVADRLFDGRLV